MELIWLSQSLFDETGGVLHGIFQVDGEERGILAKEMIFSLCQAPGFKITAHNNQCLTFLQISGKKHC
jgi:hypothetical protein